MDYKISELLDKRNALLKLMNIEIRDVENKYERVMTELLKDCDHMFDDGTPAVRINYTGGNSCRICGKYLPKPRTDLDSKKELIQELKAILCNTDTTSKNELNKLFDDFDSRIENWQNNSKNEKGEKK